MHGCPPRVKGDGGVQHVDGSGPEKWTTCGHNADTTNKQLTPHHDGGHITQIISPQACGDVPSRDVNPSAGWGHVWEYLTNGNMGHIGM